MKKLVLLLMLFSLKGYSDTLNVAVKVSPPFVTEDIMTGHIGGLAVDMVTDILEEEGISYKLVSKSEEFKSLVGNTDDYDLLVSSTSITAERIGKVHFTQPYYQSSASIVMEENEYNIMDTILTWDFFKNVLLLFTIVLFLGTIFWIVERRKSELFDKGPWGILDGSYFVTAVMGTFGFGDIVTKTKTGKIICILLMWLSLFITGIFVANISSALTVAALDEDNFNLNDLSKMKVGTIEGTTSSEFLQANGIKYVTYDNALEALDAINEGSLSAFVYDTPVLKYFLSRDKYEGLRLAPTEFKKETYGLISGDDELINKLNPLLLKKIQSDEWDATLAKYNLD